MTEEDIKKLIEDYKEYSKKNGFQLNPNDLVVENIVKKLLENQEKHGARYCPCRMLTGDDEEDKKKICPCVWHKKEIEEMGHCHCNLFAR